MKIVIDARLLDRVNNTGISRYIEFLFKYYCGKYPKNHIYIISNDKMFRYDQCNVIYTKLKPYNILHFFIYYFKIVRLNPTLYHAPFYSGLAFGSKEKVIVTVHDLMYRIVPSFFSPNIFLNRIKILYFDCIVGLSLKHADEIISVSQTTNRDVSKFFKRNSVTIPENSEITVAANDTIITKYNLSNKRYFFYCGNSRPHKNLDILYKVFEVNDDLPLLVLAGKGHRNTKNVLCVGTISDNELKTLYSAAIAFVFPSFYEGFGLPILESFYSKTIVVASRISAFLEFENENILFFDPNSCDELYLCLKKAERQEFVENNFVDRFDDKSLMAQYDGLLNKMGKA